MEHVLVEIKGTKISSKKKTWGFFYIYNSAMHYYKYIAQFIVTSKSSAIICYYKYNLSNLKV
jgi:hypothetical protein